MNESRVIIIIIIIIIIITYHEEPVFLWQFSLFHTSAQF